MMYSLSMKICKISIIFIVFVFASCSEPSIVDIEENIREKKPSTQIEQIPSNLSIPHFREMALSGTNLTFDRILESNDVYTKHAISYQSNGLRITGVFLLPHGDGPYPLLIFNHGFIDPAVYTQGRGLKREEDYIARQGFAVLHTDYRGHAGSDPSPMIDNVYDGNLEYAMDSANAILAVRDARLPSVDAENVGMLGHSLGGGVTLAILTGKTDLVSAAVLYAPVHAEVWENFSRWRAMREEGDRTIAAFGTIETHPKFWADLSPSTFLSDIKAPVLLFQGSKDSDVPKEWSDFLAESLNEHGKALTYIEYEGEKHEFSFQWLDFMKKTTDFFRESLIPKEFIPPLSLSRVTKKPFGLYVDQYNSPVNPEKFSGFHTGMDFETSDDEVNVSIKAACTGEVIEKKNVGGYGGVVVQRCTYKGAPVTVLYGHIRLSSVTHRVGETLSIGQPFGFLGKGFSTETDGERQHLHLGIHRGAEIEWRGYVQSEGELADWLHDIW